MDGLKEINRKMQDEKYGPIIAAAVKRCSSVQEISKEIGLPMVSTWRIMRRLGYQQFNGWRKAR